MPNYAVIKDNYVVNVIVADSKEDAELLSRGICIEYNSENPAGIGLFWDGNKFINPFTISAEKAITEGTLSETSETTQLP